VRRDNSGGKGINRMRRAGNNIKGRLKVLPRPPLYAQRRRENSSSAMYSVEQISSVILK
jgi:hypothetical protein